MNWCREGGIDWYALEGTDGIIATAGKDGKVGFLDLTNDCSEFKFVDGYGGELGAIEWNHHGNILAVGGSKGELSMWRNCKPYRV